MGVDLAAADSNTALAVLARADGRWRLRTLSSPATDEQILASVRALPADSRIGFDCPLGWPAAFVDFIADHSTVERAGY